MSVRQERMADEVRDLLASCFLGGQMQDPRLRDVTITAVKMTGDLQLASVYFRLIQEDTEKAREAAVAGLESATGYFRRKIADAINVRRVPNLRFFFDESVDRGSEIEGILRRLD